MAADGERSPGGFSWYRLRSLAPNLWPSLPCFHGPLHNASPAGPPKSGVCFEMVPQKGSGLGPSETSEGDHFCIRTKRLEDEVPHACNIFISINIACNYRRLPNRTYDPEPEPILKRDLNLVKDSFWVVSNREGVLRPEGDEQRMTVSQSTDEHSYGFRRTASLERTVATRAPQREGTTPFRGMGLSASPFHPSQRMPMRTTARVKSSTNLCRGLNNQGQPT